MVHPMKESVAGTVNLDSAAEARFLAHVLRRGGYVVTTAETTAAEAVNEALELVGRVLTVLEHVVAPDDLPPIIQDKVSA